MHLQGHIEVEAGLSLFGTGDAWESATVSETVPDQSIDIGGGHRGQN